MKNGQTYHEFDCPCDFCKLGDTRHPAHRLRNDDGELMYVKDRDQICQATFKNHCQYPKCDCDRPVTAAVINSTEFPRSKRLAERFAELDANLAGGYIGGMTEWWQRQKDFLLKKEKEHAKECRCETCRYWGA